MEFILYRSPSLTAEYIIFLLVVQRLKHVDMYDHLLRSLKIAYMEIYILIYRPLSVSACMIFRILEGNGDIKRYVPFNEAASAEEQFVNSLAVHSCS